MSLSHFVPEIVEKLEFPVISTFLVKHNLLTVHECYEDYLKPIQMGTISRTDLMWKLLTKLEKKPQEFYLALSESVNDPIKETNENHLALLKLLSSEMVYKSIHITLCKVTSKAVRCI